SMAIGIELKGESYGLLIDTVGEVMKLGDDTRESNPVNLDTRLARVSGGVHRLDGQLMVILDVDFVLNTAAEPMAAGQLCVMAGEASAGLSTWWSNEDLIGGRRFERHRTGGAAHS